MSHGQATSPLSSVERVVYTDGTYNLPLWVSHAEKVVVIIVVVKDLDRFG